MTTEDGLERPVVEREAASASPSAGLSLRLSQTRLQKSRCLRILAEARRYAEEMGCDAWQFAVEWKHLREAGISVSELRYLIMARLVQQGHEITHADEIDRRFRMVPGRRIGARAAFALTEEGWNWIQSQACMGERETPLESRYVSAARVTLPLNAASFSGALSPTESGEFPRWDPLRRELRVGKDVVKRFKLPCPNQETILAAFEEEGWPPRLDDPLPPHPDHDSKQRLRDTLRSLNRNQKSRRLTFKGDGTGQGILWEPYVDDAGANGIT